ncbi:hypothetical protein Pr1d_53640 [Bythopirellula goksoeyrii]|uniref:Uncharacterized protein n=1 Tax=Bythopirellula goksoeyrii TaxID=1400387 RepID=A0A5B9QLY6_9BACT|nr:hypothetical protein Pr1d_53640 [Bythopirellula goksoeyrii]
MQRVAAKYLPFEACQLFITNRLGENHGQYCKQKNSRQSSLALQFASWLGMANRQLSKLAIEEHVAEPNAKL